MLAPPALSFPKDPGLLMQAGPRGAGALETQGEGKGGLSQATKASAAPDPRQMAPNFPGIHVVRAPPQGQDCLRHLAISQSERSVGVASTPRYALYFFVLCLPPSWGTSSFFGKEYLTRLCT